MGKNGTWDNPSYGNTIESVVTAWLKPELKDENGFIKKPSTPESTESSTEWFQRIMRL